VRRFVASLLIVLFASLYAVYGICCPDGCTHEWEASSESNGPQPMDGLCVLCLGSLTDPVGASVSADALAAAEIARTPMTHPADVPADPPDHPPRS
jgi:hypothetical protein